MQPPATYQPSAATEAQELHKQAQTWFAVSVVSSVFCLSLCLGIGGAVFCYLAMQAATHGQTADAQAKLKWGKVLTLVGSVIGIISTSMSLIFR
jgi:hypothetical protein